MARYRKIDPRIWKDTGFRQFTLEEKAIAVYLFTAQSNRIGLFNFSPAMAAEDLETFPETFAKAFEKVCRVLSWAYDEVARVLYIPTWFKYNCPENPNVLLHCLKDLEDIPETPLLQAFLSHLTYLPETFHETFHKGCREPSAKQEQEQEQEQETSSSRARALSGARDQDAAATAADLDGDREGALDPQLIGAIQALQSKAFHCLTQPLRVNEKFWDAQIDKIQHHPELTLFACLLDADVYLLKEESRPRHMTEARKLMGIAIDGAITKLLRRAKKVNHG